MMNVKETLKRLHKKLPAMGLDELFELLDCYVEEFTLTSTEPKIRYHDYKIDTMPIKTNGVEFNKNSISCSTSNKIDRKYDGNITTTGSISSSQLTACH